MGQSEQNKAYIQFGKLQTSIDKSVREFFTIAFTKA